MPAELRQLGWNLLREDLSLPAAVLYEEAAAQPGVDAAVYRGLWDEAGLRTGKTTMAPKLFAMQLAGGAWGITVATAHQAVVADAHGVRRV